MVLQAIVSFAPLCIICGVNSLLVKVESNGKVLPLALKHGSLPKQLHLLVKQFPGRGGVVLADDGTRLELELVSGEIGLFVPDILLLLEPKTRKRDRIKLTMYSWLRLRGRLLSCIRLK